MLATELGPILRDVVSMGQWGDPEPHAQLTGYRPKVRLDIATSRYIIRTAQNEQDLHQALSLRHQVFYEELLKSRHPTGLDLDEYDLIFDHILLIDKETGELMGTYRLNCSRFNASCYSESEFNCRNLKNLPGNRLELGRACMHPDHRVGALFMLLWRGILAYAAQTDSRFLYGCASLKTVDLEAASAIYRELNALYGCDARWRVYPRPEYRLSRLNAPGSGIPTYVDGLDPMELVPPLLWFYLKAGARICGEPALDKAFACVDIPIILDMRDALQRIRQRMSG